MKLDYCAQSRTREENDMVNYSVAANYECKSWTAQAEREGCHSHTVHCLWDCGRAVAGSAGLDVSILVSLASFISGGLLP